MKPVDKCPFCGDEFEEEYAGDEYRHYQCRGKDDHTYIQSYSLTDPDEVVKLIIRVGPGDTRYYLKVDFVNEKTKTWSGRFNDQYGKEIIISHAVEPDLTKGMEAMIKQIKLYLTFS